MCGVQCQLQKVWGVWPFKIHYKEDPCGTFFPPQLETSPMVSTNAIPPHSSIPSTTDLHIYRFTVPLTTIPLEVAGVPLCFTRMKPSSAGHPPAGACNEMRQVSPTMATSLLSPS
jgi:hypothetical protein